MPRSRSVVERTSALGPASVRTVSLRAGIASTRILQLIGRRAMCPAYVRVWAIRNPGVSIRAPLSTYVLRGRSGDGMEVAAFRVLALHEAAAGPAAFERERLAARVAATVLGVLRGREDAPSHLAAALAPHQHPHRREPYPHGASTNSRYPAARGSGARRQGRARDR